ncbi:MAG: SPFH domain-containing protein [Bacteroidota bacterium]|jgi:membrane protease subunit (stomatin/prohibitin family)|nr:SPFH domain-containing protein [Bacteroidales bacterium]MDI9534551.1 SPFH domain-containing protein [Bacteroidota bacterium]OQC45822.1 MAG: SPFH domain / Band 7 family protein [Bacteroidetes bacterium ADurb.Bin028]NLP20184.1 SPFH domain-containing protein [Bacteroidales bacterium]HNY44290.1 SPFH domain-containing protein [Bacteroidales bacterium]
MGIFNKLRNEFIDIIEWLDPSNDIIVHRFERYQNEIKMGAKLTVRESQVAVFVNEGQIADVFQPGMYTLQTQNMPILSTLKGWKYGFNSPFKAEVYFVNTKKFLDNKWGTPNPVMLRDAEFGPVRIRAFGVYEFRVVDAAKFIKDVVGTDGSFTTDQVTNQLRNIIVTRFTDAVGEAKIPVLDMAANYNEFSEKVAGVIIDEYREYGLEMTKFLVSNISLPPNVEEALDKRSSMGIIGNMNQYTQFQAANAMEAAATNPGGGTASEGMGMGMGFAMAGQMMNAMNQGHAQQQQPQQQAGGAVPPPMPQALTFYAVINGAQAGPYDMNVLQQMVANGSINKDTLVWKQGMANWIAAGQVPELTGLFGAVPPPPPPPPPVG